jgi:repressor LexA
MMHRTQQLLLELSKSRNLARMTLRETAKAIGLPDEAPQKIKHHLAQLQKKGFLKIDRARGVSKRTDAKSGMAKTAGILTVPIIGTANCGPATIFAEENFTGFLHVSARLLDRARSLGLFAIKADGSSMNRAEIRGKSIEDGDYIIVDSHQRDPENNDVVLAIVDGRATVKRFIDDRRNGQVVLQADSSYDYEPVFLHPEDDFSINGKVVGVIKKPKI